MNIKDFIELATSAPSADNSQPWRFSIADDSLIVQFHDRHNGHDLFGALGHGTLISGGALCETVRSILWSTEHFTELPVQLDGAQGWRIDIPILAIEKAFLTDTCHAIRNRHTNRHPYKALSAQALENISLSTNSNTRINLITEKKAIRSIASSLRSCSEARFNEPELHEWLFSSMRWNEKEAKSGTGLDIATLHLPPGGRHFMRWIAPWKRMKLLNHLGIYKILAHTDSALLRQAPAIIAFSGGSSINDIWEAGRAIQSTWISLNQAGIAVHPYYAITDLGNRLQSGRLNPNWIKPITEAQESIRELLSIPANEQLHILFRIGLPTVRAARSQRLPASSFLQD